LLGGLIPVHAATLSDGTTIAVLVESVGEYHVEGPPFGSKDTPKRIYNGPEYLYGVRVLFQKVGGEWLTFCPPKSTYTRPTCDYSVADNPLLWSIRFNGKTMGTIQTQGWLDPDSVSGQGRLKVTSNDVPRVRRRTKEFSGWIEDAVARPLIATREALPRTAPYWKPAKARPDDKRKIVPFVISNLTRIDVCALSKSGNSLSDTRAPLPQDLEEPNSWKSPSGEWLHQIGVRRKLFKDCEGGPSEQTELWVFQDQARALRLMPDQFSSSGPSYPQFRLLDSADFDQDGQIETIFFYSGYNEDGFVLFDSSFSKTVRYTWGYH
jgi:hypothetical protein